MAEDLNLEQSETAAPDRRVLKSAAWSASVIARAVGAPAVGELTRRRQSSVSR